jgi:predicted MFS family arabinose efflux permease
VYVGTGLALVVGSPLTALMSQLWGWRLAVAAITAAAVVVLVAARFAVPLMAMPETACGPRQTRHHRNRRLVTMSVLTLIGVTGHFISYTFIVAIIRDIVGLRGSDQAWLLAAYGIAGLAAMALLARSGDRRPKAAVIGCLAGLAMVFAVLAGLASGDRHTAATVLVGIVAVVAWGGTATAMSPMLQSAAMRHSPEDPDGASGLYVAAFQVGIMAGSLLGGVLFARGGEVVMLTASALLIVAALACVIADRRLLVEFGVADQK